MPDISIMHALCRAVSPAITDCELSFIDRESIDVALAQAQHRDYIAALGALGVRVTELPAEPVLPDSVFVEDSVLLFDELAVLTRPGAISRRAEVDAIAPVVQSVRSRVERITQPGTVDGGDVLCIGQHVFVGLSQRSNQAAIDQLTAVLKPFGYAVTAVPIRNCLHLKSAVTALSDDTVLINPEWVAAGYFDAYRQIRVAESETHAANVVRIGAAILMPSCFPETRALVQAAGFAVSTVDVSELQKAEGAVTCCCVLFTG
jgi:dimethylargininase